MEAVVDERGPQTHDNTAENAHAVGEDTQHGIIRGIGLGGGQHIHALAGQILHAGGLSGDAI